MPPWRTHPKRKVWIGLITVMGRIVLVGDGLPADIIGHGHSSGQGARRSETGNHRNDNPPN
jgi:hypothetical protein